ncbi:hypothetical protein SU32_14560 [Ahrensia marina]|uniref:Uncharacterized protein n=1 Tax=Ahrensia marina TaxID=1514904 RepID=A0A0M9GL74_9HYPH|nr:hypothetical protein SU32_14560 [Ahrensia marina]
MPLVKKKVLKQDFAITKLWEQTPIVGLLATRSTPNTGVSGQISQTKGIIPAGMIAICRSKEDT